MAERVDYSEHASLVSRLSELARSECRVDDAGSLCGKTRKRAVSDDEEEEAFFECPAEGGEKIDTQ